MTLLLPLPKYPCSHKTNCLYAAFLKLAIEKSRGSTPISHLALIASSRTCRSVQRLLNSSYEVMHSLLWQHYFLLGWASECNSRKYTILELHYLLGLIAGHRRCHLLEAFSRNQDFHGRCLSSG